jgi:hypothetical protein
MVFSMRAAFNINLYGHRLVIGLKGFRGLSRKLLRDRSHRAASPPPPTHKSSSLHFHQPPDPLYDASRRSSTGRGPWLLDEPATQGPQNNGRRW